MARSVRPSRLGCYAAYDRRSGKDGDDPGDLLSMSLSIDRGCMASILINRLQVGDFSRVC